MDYTITASLKELKTLDKRIRDNISASCFCAVKTGDKMPVGFLPEEEFKVKAKTTLQSITDLISRRDIIKSKIVESNAKTNVTINNIVYTVAGAIERKKSIEYAKLLVSTIGLQILNTVRQAENINLNVQRLLDQHISTMLGKEAKDKGGQDVEDMTTSYLKRNSASIIDPIDAKATLSALEEDINNFIADVDVALSVSNAITTITI